MKTPHPPGYWTFEKVIEEGKKYRTKGEFKKNSPTAYSIACHKGLMASMNWFQNGRAIKRGPYKGHKYTLNAIASIIKDKKCITITDLRKINEYAYKQARDNNWLKKLGLIENKHADGYWTPENVWKIALNYTNKKDFQKNQRVAYNWACKYKMLNRMSWMKCPTYNERREDHESEVYAYLDERKRVVYVGLSINTNNRKKSHRYQKNSAVHKYFGKNIPEPKILMSNLTLDESTYWEDYYRNYYSKKNYRVLNVAPTGLNTGSLGGIPKWSLKSDVFKESHKYDSRSEFKKKAGGAYNHALSNGWLDEMTWLRKPLHPIKWTREKVFEESHKYNYRGEFCNGSQRAYTIAKQNGWIEEMPWIKEKRKPTNYWTKMRVMEESKKYSSQKDFQESANGAYQAAIRQGWIKEMTWLKNSRKK